MEIKIIGKHLEITEAINDYIKKRFQSVSFPDKTNVVEIRLEAINKNQHRSEVVYSCEKKRTHIKSEKEDLYHAIDLLVDKTKRSVTKLKEKKNVHLHHVNKM